MKMPAKKIIFNTTLFFIACLSVILCTVSCSKSAKNAANNSKSVTPVTTANFTIVGTKIMDINGNEFIAKGVNVNGPYWPWPRPTIPDVSLITDVWKANAVRVNCWPEFSIYNSNNTDLDGIVNAFTGKKVVTILEEHNFTGKYPSTGELSTLTAWWVSIANKYKNNAYVWFNIMNEPGSSGPVTQAWMDAHDAVIKAIRNTGATNIIVCDENAFGQANGFDSPAGSAVLTYGSTLASRYSNILFSLHLYDQWVYGSARLDNYIAAVRSKNLPLIFGEYGVGSDNSMEVASTVFKAAIANKIGRIAWHWAGVDLHKLTTTGEGGGFSIENTSGTKPTNLSFAGNLVWDDNHGTLAVTDNELIPPPVILYNGDFEAGSPSNGDAVGNGWINFGTATIDQTSANVQQGQSSVKIAAGSAGGCGEPIYLAPGNTYQLTAWGKHDIIASALSNVALKYTTTFGGAETQIASLDFTENAYVQKSVTFIVPAQVTSMFLFIYKNDPAPIFWCDNITIVKL